MEVTRWCAVVALLAMPAACGDDASSSNDETSPGVQRWCDALTGPYCEALFACCSDPSRLLYPSVEACKARECSLPAIQDLLTRDRTELDEGRLQACVSSLTQLKSTCDEPPGFVLALCQLAFRGDVPEGQSCDSAHTTFEQNECAAGVCTDAGCQAFLPSGAPCNLDHYPPDARCNLPEGEWCILETATGGHCGPRLGIGATCVPSPSEPAGGQYQCLSSNCEAGKCTAPADTLLCL